jgi:hypothetical protein
MTTTPLRALALVCTLNPPPPAPAPNCWPTRRWKRCAHGVTGETVRIVDHDVRPGVHTDKERETLGRPSERSCWRPTRFSRVREAVAFAREGADVLTAAEQVADFGKEVPMDRPASRPRPLASASALSRREAFRRSRRSDQGWALTRTSTSRSRLCPGA